jgi:hypothetical protein
VKKGPSEAFEVNLRCVVLSLPLALLLSLLSSSSVFIVTRPSSMTDLSSLENSGNNPLSCSPVKKGTWSSTRWEFRDTTNAFFWKESKTFSDYTNSVRHLSLHFPFLLFRLLC